MHRSCVSSRSGKIVDCLSVFTWSQVNTTEMCTCKAEIQLFISTPNWFYTLHVFCCIIIFFSCSNFISDWGFPFFFLFFVCVCIYLLSTAVLRDNLTAHLCCFSVLPSLSWQPCRPLSDFWRSPPSGSLNWPWWVASNWCQNNNELNVRTLLLQRNKACFFRLRYR